MKKFLVLFVSLLLLNILKAQDTSASYELQVRLGGTNAGINVFNEIGHSLALPDMGKATFITTLAFSINIKKSSYEINWVGGNKEVSSGPIRFSASYFNLGYTYKYRFINAKRMELKGLANINLQSFDIQIDSVKPISSLLNYSSNNISKGSFAVGPGVELILKGKRPNFPVIYGIRGTYNFYFKETDWEKAGNKKFKQYPDNDLGFMDVSVFFGFRFLPRVAARK